ncbi:hypothetical protein [Actinomadura rudentiformis]|uniref:Uncharacterized protein n=1 Tax=Actinomadura rudentiformis TaxID=359158 RepID=A0A6H9YYZ9_9ACTN|nr:hypothetical protein [Actinomadura rudentiformis]KAB2351783.1 hypothetical protein F8566_06120 [Actinomadura rudentiformis]
MSGSLRGPLHRSILALDLERSSARNNLIKVEQRRELYHVLREAMRAAGIDEHYCEPIADRGDGVLVLVHPVDEVPKSRLLVPLIPELTRLLVDYNDALPVAERALRQLRMRAVVHAGDLLCDDHGLFGTELDAAIRLLDSDVVRELLRETTTPLVLVVSQQIYESIVIHGYDGISPESYHRAVEVHVCGLTRHGWLHVPAGHGQPIPITAA